MELASQHTSSVQQPVAIHEQQLEQTASPLVLFSLIAGIALWAIAIDKKERAHRNLKN